MGHANNTSGGYHRYVKHIASDTIRQSNQLNNGTIPSRTFKKVQWYMVEALIMGEMLARLADQPVTRRNRESLVYLGAIMALFDAVVDDFRLDKITLNRILENTFSDSVRIVSQKETAIEKVFYLYLDKLTGTIEKEYWKEISGHLNIIKLQIGSDEQYGKDISEESVTRITLGKGGVSAFICSVFLKQKSDSFRSAVFEMGGLIQMMNDCQDIYKDTVAGIKTFVHFRNDFGDIFNRLDEQRRKTFNLIIELDLLERRKHETIFDLNAMFIVIAYKLQRYADACNYCLDFNTISNMDRKYFRINPFSPGAIAACYGRIMQFDFKRCQATPDFKFDKS